MWTLIAAALLAAQPAQPSGLSEDADFQCLAIVAVVLGQVPKESLEDLRTVTGLTSIFMYYLGRLDARYPTLDFVEAFKSLDGDPVFASRFAAQAERCSAEAEKRSKQLQDMGRILQNQPAPLPGQSG